MRFSDSNEILPVIHWPVAFVPGRGFYPPHPTKPGEVELDTETSLVDTWKAVIELKKTGKVRRLHTEIECGTYLDHPLSRSGQGDWCLQLHD